MMQVNFTEAGVIGKETSVRRRESKFGKGEGICREEKSKTSPIASIISIPRWTYRKEPPQSPSSLVRIQFAVTNVEHVVLIPPIPYYIIIKIDNWAPTLKLVNR